MKQNCTTAILSDTETFVRFAEEGEPTNNTYYSGTCDFRFDNNDDTTIGDIGDIGDNHTVDPITFEFWNTQPDKLTMYGDVFRNVPVNTSATIQSIWMVRVANFTESFNGSMYTRFESFVSDFYWCHKELKGVTVSENGFETRSVYSRPWASAEGDRFHNGASDPKDGRNDSIGYNVETSAPYLYNVAGEPTYRITRLIYGAMQQTVRWIIAPKLYWNTPLNGGYPNYDRKYQGILQDGIFASFLLFDDVEAYTNRLADALTGFMLTPDADNINVTMVPGYMVYNDIFFEVQWVWLSLLAVEYLSGAILLATTIYITRGQSLLKNSSTALLASTLFGWKEEELRVSDPQTLEKWDRLTEGMVALFSEEKNGRLRFNRAVDSE